MEKHDFPIFFPAASAAAAAEAAAAAAFDACLGSFAGVMLIELQRLRGLGAYAEAYGGQPFVRVASGGRRRGAAAAAAEAAATISECMFFVVFK